jgi:hypothetical protein
MKEDCLSCKVTGTAVCLGLSGYLVAKQYAQPVGSPSTKVLTLAVAGSLAAMGIARAILY